MNDFEIYDSITNSLITRHMRDGKEKTIKYRPPIVYLLPAELKKYYLYIFLIECYIERKTDVTLKEILTKSITMFRGTHREGECFFEPPDFIRSSEELVYDILKF